MLLDFSQNGINIVFEVTDEDVLALKELGLSPHHLSVDKDIVRCAAVDIHLSGESAEEHHGSKHIGTYGARSLKYRSHSYNENKYGNKLELYLSNERIEATLHCQFFRGVAAVRFWVTVTNISSESVGLEYVSSFSYVGLEGSAPSIYIPHNSWCSEVNWKKYSLPELGLDRANSFSTKRIAVSNTGSWSTKEYLPMGAVEDIHGTLMWQIESNGAWQWEISDIEPSSLYLKAGGPSEQENGWYKELSTGESFESVKVAVTLGDSFDRALGQMTAYRRAIFENNTQNRALRVIFNDFMYCMRCEPTAEKLFPVIDKAAEIGVEYFCTDAGWYADGNWWDTVGEWKPCEWRFPKGIKEVFDRIREKGMIPGIWLEIEVMGTLCPSLSKLEDECFFMRHGKRVVYRGRYQLDFRHPKTRRYVTDVVDRVVREYGVGYIKFDYNIDIGAGTEVGAHSFGDGLLEHNRAYLGWLDEIKTRYPELVIENCSSGGMRMDYAMLAKHHVQSVSDQEDAAVTAVIAANCSTAVLPEQAAIWSCPLSTHSDSELRFVMANSMLTRMHLGGEIALLCPEKFVLVKKAIEKYKEYRHVLLGATPFYPLGLNSYGRGFASVGYKTDSEKYVEIWRMGSYEDTVTIPVSGSRIETVYPTEDNYLLSLGEGGVNATLPEKYSAVIFKITR